MPVSGKTIAKNTVFLYLRMLLVLLVSLYTSRVILAVMGASDFGLNNVIAGIVSMFTFINGSLTAGTSRFITYDLGIGSAEKLNKTFNVALMSHIIIAIIVFLLAETIGLWFVNEKIVFDNSRQVAVNIVYQTVVLRSVLQIIMTPFTADIVAHENMSIYAYVGVGEALSKLGIVLLIQHQASWDALIWLNILMTLLQISIISIYISYCKIHYRESKWHLIKNSSEYKEIFSFSAWDIMGVSSVLAQGEGINVLLNIYFGPLINAARAISYQVQGAFSQFSGNFMMAVRPEIVKNYAQDRIQDVNNLINQSALYSFFLLILITLPAIFRIDYILDLWLVDVPDGAPLFTSIILVLLLVRSLARPVIDGVHATGDIKRLNLYAGGLGLLALPAAWACLKMGGAPVSVFWVLLIWGAFANIAEVIIYKLKVPAFSIKQHLISVYARAAISTATATVSIFFLNNFFPQTFLWFIIYFISSCLVIAVIIYVVGLNRNIRGQVRQYAKSKLQSIIKRD